MDRRKMLAFLGVSPALVAGASSPALAASAAPAAAAPARAFDPKFTVLSPMGTPPAIKSLAMAPRPKSLNGKTVYFVDDGFPGTDVLMKEMAAWFNQNIPGMTAIYRLKAGGFPQVDPALWAEIKAKGDAVVMGVGH
ncbi:MAG: hypothetical protein ACLP3K_11010 [Candidatus Acidiferrales bacterium]